MPRVFRFVVGLSLGLGLVSALAATGPVAFAQGPDTSPGMSPNGLARMPGAPGGMNMVMVMMAPAVQEELKLTEEQKTQVFELARNSQRKGRDLMLQAQANPQGMMAAGLRLRQENEQAATKLLKKEQKERAEQILLQVEGPLAVARPEIAGKLNLSQNQTQQVQYTMMQLMMAVRGMAVQSAVAAANGNGGGAMTAQDLTQLRRAAVRQIGGILNAKQRAAFDALLGEPFDLAKIDPELARPAASAPTAPAKAASRVRRKGVAASKKNAAAAATKGEGDAETPKP